MQRTVLALLVVSCFGGCAGVRTAEEPVDEASRGGIVVVGERIPVDARVVTFEDGGFDARCERCWFDEERTLPTSPADGCDTPHRFRIRPADDLAPALRKRVAREGWTRETLRERISQVIFHYDACGTSSRCFEVLHDVRGLSCHFLVDVDGTIYQTLDLTARARHAGRANDMSIGVEIAHIGAYPPGDGTFARYYRDTPRGLELMLPESLRAPPGRFRPARTGMFTETVNGREVVMPDFTADQYRALAALTDALAREFPRLPRRTPRADDGAPLQRVLPPGERESFEGFLGHHHVSPHKTDPGPAFDWERVLGAGD